MVRVFVDSNTIISALAFGGNELKVLKLLRKTKNCESVISEDVAEEVAKVLAKKFPEKSKRLFRFLGLMITEIISTNEYQGLIARQSCRDEKDRHVLAAATASQCDFILTGDKDLLELKTAKPKVIRSRDLLRLLGY